MAAGCDRYGHSEDMANNHNPKTGSGRKGGTDARRAATSGAAGTANEPTAPGQAPRRPGVSGRGGHGGRSQGNVRNMIAKLSEGRSSSHSPSKRRRDYNDDDDSDPDLPSSYPEVEELPGQLTPTLLQAQLKKMSEILMDKMDQTTERLSSEFAAMKQRIQDLEQHVEEQETVIDELRRAVEKKDQRVRDLECKVQDVQMEQSRPYLIFDGEGVPPPPTERPWTEDVRGTVVDMVGKYLPAVRVEKEDIEHCYRVARGRKIVCKFMRYGRGSPRDTIYEKRVNLGKDEVGQRRARSQSLYVNEMLPEGAQSAFAELRNAKREGLIHAVFTRDCRICVRMIEHGKIIRVNNSDDLDRVIREGRDNARG